KDDGASLPRTPRSQAGVRRGRAAALGLAGARPLEHHAVLGDDGDPVAARAHGDELALRRRVEGDARPYRGAALEEAGLAADGPGPVILVEGDAGEIARGLHGLERRGRG